MQRGVSTCRDDGIVRDHQDGLAVLADKLIDQRHDFVPALAVRSPVGSSQRKKVGSETMARSDGDTLFLTAG